MFKVYVQPFRLSGLGRIFTGQSSLKIASKIPPKQSSP